MKYVLEAIPGTRIVLLYCSGPITLDDRRRNLKRVVEFCQKEEIQNLIIDGRDQESRTDTVESFTFGEEVAHEMRGFKIAIVHRPDDRSLSFIELVAGNRGAYTKCFSTIESAREWLEPQYI